MRTFRRMEGNVGRYARMLVLPAVVSIASMAVPLRAQEISREDGATPKNLAETIFDVEAVTIWQDNPDIFSRIRGISGDVYSLDENNQLYSVTMYNLNGLFFRERVGQGWDTKGEQVQLDFKDYEPFRIIDPPSFADLTENSLTDAVLSNYEEGTLVVMRREELTKWKFEGELRGSDGSTLKVGEYPQIRFLSYDISNLLGIDAVGGNKDGTFPVYRRTGNPLVLDPVGSLQDATTDSDLNRGMGSFPEMISINGKAYLLYGTASDAGIMIAKHENDLRFKPISLLKDDEGRILGPIRSQPRMTYDLKGGGELGILVNSPDQRIFYLTQIKDPTAVQPGIWGEVKSKFGKSLLE
jgi:hypothetical protein